MQTIITFITLRFQYCCHCFCCFSWCSFRLIHSRGRSIRDHSEFVFQIYRVHYLMNTFSNLLDFVDIYLLLVSPKITWLYLQYPVKLENAANWQ